MEIGQTVRSAVPSASGISSAGASSPALIRTERMAAGKTLYVDIDLRIAGRRPMTAIFLPDGYRAEAECDVVMYLHGWQLQTGVTEIDQYLERPFGKLREGLVASGKNAIFVAPTLGPESEAGILTSPGGLDWFLTLCLAAATNHGELFAVDAALNLRHLILAGHSGAGARMRELVQGSNTSIEGTSEFWGYDSLYSDEDLSVWPNWARDHTDARIKFYYIDRSDGPSGSPADNPTRRGRDLQGLRLGNLIVERSRVHDHMLVPLTYWGPCLDDAGFLQIRAGAGSPEEAATS